MSWMFFLLFSFSLFAQESITVKGVLLEKGTRKPLKDVSVFILPHKIKAVTTEKGDFLFEAVPAGSCTLIINLTGYEKLERDLDCGKTPNLNFYLEKKNYFH